MSKWTVKEFIQVLGGSYEQKWFAVYDANVVKEEQVNKLIQLKGFGEADYHPDILFFTEEQYKTFKRMTDELRSNN